MSELVTIRRDNCAVTVSPDGAWLETFTYDGSPVLAPKQEFTTPTGEKKTRGGSHVCVPNFGPGGNSGLPQHGFGREETWSVVKSDADMVELELAQHDGEYSGLVSNVAYQLGDAALTMQLVLQNNGNKELRVAPAFHPYFAVPEGQAILLDEKPVDTTQISDAQLLNTAPQTISIGVRRVRLSARNLSSWVLWSDQLGPYVCVEPTFAGNSFERKPNDNEILKPGRSSSYSLTISIQG